MNKQTQKVARIENKDKVKYSFSADSELHKAMVNAVNASNIRPIPVYLSPVKPEELREVGGLNRDIATIDVQKDSRLETIFDAVLDTLTAQNELGQVLSEAKDVISYIVPIMGPIDALTDEITNLIDQEAENLTNPNTMTNKDRTFFETIKHYWQQDSTKQAVGLIVTVALGLIAGIQIDTQAFLQSVTGIITGLAAVFTAVYNIIGLFRNNKK